MRRPSTMIIIFLVATSVAWGQRITIDADFEFADGIYFSSEQLKRNQPDINSSDYRIVTAISASSLLMRVDAISKNNGDSISTSNIWAVCVEGKPYIQIDRQLVGESVATFSGLIVQGPLSYYFYEEELVSEVEIKAYNPLNGRPFRKGKVPKTEVKYRHQLLNLSTKNTVLLTRKSVEEAIKEDLSLLRTVRNMPPDLDLESLLNVIKRFNERNPLVIQK